MFRYWSLRVFTDIFNYSQHKANSASDHPQSIWVSSLIKGTVHPQKVFLKYVMLRTVTKNSTIVITKYTRYHRYREIIQITGGPPLRLYWKPDLKAGRSKLKCSDVT